MLGGPPAVFPTDLAFSSDALDRRVILGRAALLELPLKERGPDARRILRWGVTILRWPPKSHSCLSPRASSVLASVL